MDTYLVRALTRTGAKCGEVLARSPLRMVGKEAPMVWVVTHVRSGTKTLTELLNLSPTIVAFHEPMPRLWWMEANICQSTYADIWSTVYLSCRWELVSQVCSFGQVFGEVNGRAVWFTHTVKKNFPNVKIIHLYRDRDDVIKSMYRKGFFKGNSPFSVGRPNMKGSTRREKVAEYYDLIEDFIQELPYDMLEVPFAAFSDRNTDEVKRMYDWLEVEAPSTKAITNTLDMQLNKGESWHVEKNWEDRK